MAAGLISRPVRNLEKFQNDDDEVVNNEAGVVTKMKMLELNAMVAEDPRSRWQSKIYRNFLF